jgi:hypothetical protein
MDIELASYVLHFRCVLFTIKLLHKFFQILFTLLMPYWTSSCVLCRICRQDYETLFPVLIFNLIKLQYYKLAMSYAKQTNNNDYNYELFEDRD